MNPTPKKHSPEPWRYGARAKAGGGFEKIIEDLKVLAGIKADAVEADADEFEKFAKMAGLPAKAGEELVGVLKEFKGRIDALTAAKAKDKEESNARVLVVEGQVATLLATIETMRGEAKAFHDKGVAALASVEAAVAKAGQIPALDQALQDKFDALEKKTREEVEKAFSGGGSAPVVHFALPPGYAEKLAALEKARS